MLDSFLRGFRFLHPRFFPVFDFLFFRYVVRFQVSVCTWGNQICYRISSVPNHMFFSVQNQLILEFGHCRLIQRVSRRQVSFFASP